MVRSKPLQKTHIKEIHATWENMKKNCLSFFSNCPIKAVGNIPLQSFRSLLALIHITLSTMYPTLCVYQTLVHVMLYHRSPKLNNIESVQNGDGFPHDNLSVDVWVV